MNGSFEGKKNTDKWFPVRLVDDADYASPETGKAYGDIACKYGFEASESESAYSVAEADWKEQGDGNYWLQIGESEFTSEGKYEVKVECPGCHDFNFVVEVCDKTVAELIDDVATLVARLTSDRAGYLDKLNVAGTLANTDNAAGFKATGFSTHDAAAVKTAMEADGSKLDHLWETTEDDGGTRRFTANALEEGPGGGSAPSAAEVADAVWDEQQSGHTAAGSFGDYLDSQVSGVSGIGAGALDVTVTCNDDQGHPLDGVAVWISTDEAGSNVVAGTRYTNASGLVAFKLDAGTYWVHRQLSGHEFSPNPKQETVS